MAHPRVSASDESSRPRALLAIVLGLVIVLGAYALASRRIDRERRGLVERRLAASAELLRETARDVLASRSSREGLGARMRDLGAATGVRITLILPNGEVLAESEVRTSMPNLADRAEVREAGITGLATASRKSAMTGKETLYLAVGIEENGARLGTLRVATDASEVGGLLRNMELEIAAAVAAALALGMWAGFRFAPRMTGSSAPRESTAEPTAVRKAA